MNGCLSVCPEICNFEKKQNIRCPNKFLSILLNWHLINNSLSIPQNINLFYCVTSNQAYD